MKETYGSLNTNFYKVFEKKSLLAFQPFDLLFDTQTREGDFVYAKIPNRAQRIINMFLYVQNPKSVELFEILIDGTIVYSFTGEYMFINNELRRPASKKRLDYLIVPIMKYFPILENTQVRLKLKSSKVQVKEIKLTIDWCFDKLPTDGDYIINQVQTYYGDPSKPVRTNFYNVVKELIFCIQNQGDNSTDYQDTVNTMTLSINGFEKFNSSGMYFRYIQPMEYHTNAPGVYIYSFCLQPETDLPTGGINMSLITNQLFTFNLKDSVPKNIRIYAESYNILRVKNNKAKILFTSI